MPRACPRVCATWFAFDNDVTLASRGGGETQIGVLDEVRNEGGRLGQVNNEESMEALVTCVACGVVGVRYFCGLFAAVLQTVVVVIGDVCHVGDFVVLWVKAVGILRACVLI